ncbi:hypothetical protein QEN19_001594 [Hanseniaspora menglaensis]
MKFPDVKLIFVLSIVIRTILLVYGVIQDSFSMVKYTDIDYYVFLDSLNFIWNYDGSPYERETFRYTPLLSYMMLPTLLNVHLGKLLFVVFDVLTGFYIYKLLEKHYGNLTENSKSSIPVIGCSLWLLNPMVITISTRGNAESIMSFLIIFFLYLLDFGYIMTSGVVYGIAIHFKIYPVVYAIPLTMYFLFFMDRTNYKNIKSLVLFGVSSLFSLIGITYLVYLKFGYEFIEHTYLYHIIRSDHRHNFSVWNMVLYMEQMPSLIKQNTNNIFIKNYGSNTLKHIYYNVLNNKNLSSVPQFLNCILIPILILVKKSFKIQKKHEMKPFITLIQVIAVQTMFFVHFNKVITSQYFIWYLTYIPFFSLHVVDLFKNNKIRLIKLILVWILSQAVWLYFGFQLEFKNQNCFISLFCAGCLMLLGNVYVIGDFISAI